MNRSRPWLVAITAALLSFFMPLAFITATTEIKPEIRIVYGESRNNPFSALIVTNETRILIVNNDDRRTARSLIGALYRPWEPAHTVVIAPSGDNTFAGIHEATRNPGIRQVIVAGLPGANPEWTALERDLADRNVDLHYLGHPVVVETGPMVLTVYPDLDSPHIVIRYGSAVTVLALGQSLPPTPAHLAIANRAPRSGEQIDLVMLPLMVDLPDEAIAVERGKRITVRLNSDRIEIEDWHSIPGDGVR
jgi:hypothetical protein